MNYSIKFIDGTTKKVNTDDINKIKKYVNDNIENIISFNRTTSRKDWNNIDNLSDEDQIFMLLKGPLGFSRIKNPSEKVQLKAVEILGKSAGDLMPSVLLESKANLSPKTIEAMINYFNNEKAYWFIKNRDWLKRDLTDLYNKYSDIISPNYERIFYNLLFVKGRKSFPLK